MKLSKKEYQSYVGEIAPKSPIGKNLLAAFLVGGAICTLGQLLKNGFLSAGLSQDDAGLAVSVCLIFLSAALTAASVYDDITKHAGAGTLVPITGFANAVVSPAMEFRAEGLVTGMAAKMFVIAGPVIVYGTVTGILYGVVYFLTTIL